MGLKAYDLDFCKQFSEEKLRKIYSGEKKETLDKLVEAVKSNNIKEEAPVEEAPDKKKVDKKRK